MLNIKIITVIDRQYLLDNNEICQHFGLPFVIMVLSPKQKFFFPKNCIREYARQANCRVCAVEVRTALSGPPRPLMPQEDRRAAAGKHSCFNCHHQIPMPLVTTQARESTGCTNRLISFLAHFQIQVSNVHV